MTSETMPMELPSWLIAGIRTTVQAAIGGGLAWLAAREIVIPGGDAVILGAEALVIGATAAVLRIAEKQWPWVSRVLSLFLTKTKPVYVATADVPAAVNAVPNLSMTKAA